MAKREHSNEFLFGAVSRTATKVAVPRLVLMDDSLDALCDRLFSGGPGVEESCPLPSRWVQSLHEEAERWDGLA